MRRLAQVIQVIMLMTQGCGRIGYDPLPADSGTDAADGATLDSGIQDGAVNDAGTDAATDGGREPLPGDFVFIATSGPAGAGAGAHACALTRDGRAFCWGSDSNGQLGENTDGDNLDEPTPVQVDTSALGSTATFRSVAVGGSHTCGLASTGAAFCWGRDAAGQLGEDADADNADEPVPVQVDTTALTPGSQFIKLALGDGHTCGLTDDDLVYCWGSDNRGQLGTGGGNSNVPVPVDTSALDPGEVFTNVFANGRHSCATSNNGRAFCWGADDNGALGENADGDNLDEAVPTLIDTSALTPGTDFQEISLGARHGCGMATNGRVFCWGFDGTGALGEDLDGDNLDEVIPVPVDTSLLTPGTTFVTISAGGDHSCGIASDGRAFCWGENAAGELGIGSIGSPVNIPNEIDSSNLNIGTRFVAIHAGRASSCGITDDGAAYCWGADNTGQLGEDADGDNLDEPVPTAVDRSSL